MATNLHETPDRLADLENLMRLISSLVPLSRHLWTLSVALIETERRARQIFKLAGPGSQELSERLDELANQMLRTADTLQKTGLRSWALHRRILNASIWFAKAACVTRGENPASIPTLEPVWRSALVAYSSLFRFG